MQKVQTRRTQRNSKNWLSRVGHEIRKLNRVKFFKFKAKEKKS